MPGADLIQSVLRALDVVDAVAHSQNGMTVRDIAEELELKRPTANNLLRTLAERRYVELRTNPRRYVLGTTVSELAEVASSRSLHQSAIKVMRELQGQMPEASFTLAEPVHDELQTTLRIDRKRPGVVQRPRNERLHPYLKATSLVWQAFGGESQRAAIRKRFLFSEYGVHAWQTIGQLDDYLNHALQQGYAVSPPSYGPYRAVAAPVYDTGNSFIATLGAFISPDEDHDFQSLTQAIVGGAAKLSKLGQPDANH